MFTVKKFFKPNRKVPYREQTAPAPPRHELGPQTQPLLILWWIFCA